MRGVKIGAGGRRKSNLTVTLALTDLLLHILKCGTHSALSDPRWNLGYVSMALWAFKLTGVGNT